MLANQFDGVPTEIDDSSLLKKLGADQVLKSVQNTLDLAYRGIGVVHQGLMPCLNSWTLAEFNSGNIKYLFTNKLEEFKNKECIVLAQFINQQGLSLN